MKKLIVISLVALFVLGAAANVFAGKNPNVQFALDCQAHNTKRACATSVYASCSGITQEYHPLGRVNVMVVVYMYDTIQGVEYGLSWGVGPWFYSFMSCSDFIVGGVDLGGFMSCAQSWSAPKVAVDPDPGTSGFAVGWLDLYIYGPTRIDFIPSDQGWIKVADDVQGEDEAHTIHPGLLGSAVPEAGDLGPCEMGPTATAPSTWGSVKSLYR
jgi:hypothetical protein